MQAIKSLTLRQNFSWTFVGNIIYAASQWGMLMVLAKFGSPEMVGQFTLGLAVTAPIIQFSSLQLRQIQTTDVKQQYLFGDYLGLRLLCVSLSLLTIATISIIAGYRWETSLVILVIGLSKVFESISDIFYGLFQHHERMDRIAISLMIKGPMALLMLGLGLYFSGSVLGGAIGLTGTWALVLIFYDVPNGVSLLKALALAQIDQTAAISQHNPPVTIGDLQWQPRFNLSVLRSLVRLSLPLGLVMTLLSFNANMPRYFIQYHLGERELGIFSALSYLMVAGNIVISALGQSASPRLAKYYAAGRGKDFQDLLLKTILVGALLGGISIFMAAIAGKEILTILYRPEYAKQEHLFVLLMVAASIGYITSFLGYAMTAAQYFRVQMPLFTVATGISAFICFWLVPSHGSMGAAIALIVGLSFQLLCSLGVILHALRKIDKPTCTISSPISLK